MLITAETSTSLRSAVRRRLLVAAWTRGSGWLAGFSGLEDRAMGRSCGAAAERLLPRLYCWILSLQPSVHFFLTEGIPAAVATRQTSSSGRPKSPRIQVVLPEELCDRLASLAELESRTVSNMARVLIQQGVERLEARLAAERSAERPITAFRDALERQGGAAPSRLRGAPRRLRLPRSSG